MKSSDQNRYSLQFDHEKSVLKYYLIGKNYFTALKALGYIEQLNERLPPEKRFRKDKVTPNLHHQVRIALSITQLKGILDEETCITCALLHDVQEDLGISQSEIKDLFGAEVAEITWRLTKKYINMVKNKESYINEMCDCSVTSIVKGEDRLDNLFSMVGVFSLDKQLEYAEEAEKLFLPMIKKASKYFPSQIHAYAQISLQMKRQIEATRQYVKIAQNEERTNKRLDELQLERLNQFSKIQQLESENRGLTIKLKQFNETGVQPTFRKIAANISADHKAMVLKRVADALNTSYNGKQLAVTDIVELASLVSQVLGISTLEIQNFDSNDRIEAAYDNLGTTVHIK